MELGKIQTKVMASKYGGVWTFAFATASILGACAGQGRNPASVDAGKVGGDAEAPTDASQGGAEAGGASAREDAAVHSASDASSSDSAMPVPLTRDEFVRVTTDFSGGFCEPQCPILKRSVEAGAVLVLEDEKGVERSELLAFVELDLTRSRGHLPDSGREGSTMPKGSTRIRGLAPT